ncbi:MAG TPA: hypothetical protein VED86_06305 [archaeon]|nr:hypothetical protein [archaeon]
MVEKVLVFEPDLFFSSRIESAAEGFGLQTKVTVTEDELQSAMEESVPKALLVNLDSLPSAGQSLVGHVKGRCVLIGYYSHVDSRLATQALAGGFERVMPRRTFVAELNEIFADLSSS